MTIWTSLRRPVDERRAQRPVDQAADQDGLGRRAAFAAEEAAGDLAGGVGALFDIHRQREEVEVVLRVLAGAGGRQQHGFLVEVGSDCALRLLGEAAGFEPDRTRAELAVIENGFGEFDFWTLHRGVFSSCFTSFPVWERLVKEQERAERGARADGVHGGRFGGCSGQQ